jgi:hypothetical protein
MSETAFPVGVLGSDDRGLTKREYAAIHILAGMASELRRGVYDAETTSSISVKAADELLKQLKEEE